MPVRLPKIHACGEYTAQSKSYFPIKSTDYYLDLVKIGSHIEPFLERVVHFYQYISLIIVDVQFCI
jgi:hypothetical protein